MVSQSVSTTVSSNGGAAFKWKKNRLTYSIENFSPDLPREDVKRAIREGYDVWAAVTPLEFEEVQPGSGADIKVSSRDISSLQIPTLEGSSKNQVATFTNGSSEMKLK
ncbi:Matrixin, partial [Teladorsagia circumcincta]